MDRQSAQDKFSNCRLSIEGDQHLAIAAAPCRADYLDALGREVLGGF